MSEAEHTKSNAVAPARRRKTTTRARMLSAGRQLLAEKSIDAWAVDDIVTRASVAKGSFYNHFTDKSAFAIAIAEELRGRLRARILDANKGIHDPALRVARAYCVTLKFALADPIDAALMIQGVQATSEADHPLNSGLVADISNGQKLKRFDALEIEAGVMIVLGASYVSLTRIVKGNISLGETQSFAGHLLKTLLRGLGLSKEDAALVTNSAISDLLLR